MSDEVFHILDNDRRTKAIGYLALYETGDIVSVRNLARTISAVELGKPTRQVSTQEYESVYNGLIQNHCEILEQAGCIEYDSREKTVVVQSRLFRYANLITQAKHIQVPQR